MRSILGDLLASIIPPNSQSIVAALFKRNVKRLTQDDTSVAVALVNGDWISSIDGDDGVPSENKVSPSTVVAVLEL